VANTDKLSEHSAQEAPPPYFDLLRCPDCGGRIARGAGELGCQNCQRGFDQPRRTGQWDLRGRRPKSHTVIYDPAGSHDPSPAALIEPLRPHPDPELPNWRNLTLTDTMGGNSLTPEMASYFPRAKNGSGWMLDLGSGQSLFKPLLKQATDLSYVGIDFNGDEPDLLADAHALPFMDQAFDLVVSMRVLEHLSHPDIAMAEVYRTLKPGGVFAGSVALLEPFHMNSYFHMTHLGTNRVLTLAGFEVLAIAPNRQWTGLQALAWMSLFPGLSPRIRQALVSPLDRLNGLLWSLKRKGGEMDRMLETTGGFRFIARKPTAG
jgi:SAM-dependent methyltransferase